MTDHHSGIVVRVLVLVLILVGNMTKPLISSLVVEPSFLARVCEATWSSPDAEMRKLACRARGNHA